MSARHRLIFAMIRSTRGRGRGTGTRCTAAGPSPRPCGSWRYVHPLEARVRQQLAAPLAGRPAVGHHHVGREVVLAADQGGAHAVRVHRHAGVLEGADLRRVEAAGDDDAHVAEAGAVERVADVPDELRVHAARVEAAHLRPQRAVDHGVRGVEPHAPQPVAERARDGQGRGHGVVVEVDQDDDVRLVADDRREALRRLDGVAAVGRDQPVRHRAVALAAPPRGLRVRRHADGAGDVRRVAVAGLHAVVVVARREVHDRLARAPPRRPRARSWPPACAAPGCPGTPSPGGRTARSRPRWRDAVSQGSMASPSSSARTVEVVPAGTHAPSGAVAARALAQDGDGLVHAAEHRPLLLEHLHQHARVVPVDLQDALGEVEVRVRVVALPDLVDGQVEDLRGQPRAGRHVRGGSRAKAGGRVVPGRRDLPCGEAGMTTARKPVG